MPGHSAAAKRERLELDAWIPNFGQYVPHRPGFEYDKDQNRYRCVKPGGNGAILSYKGERMDSKGYTKHTYRSSESDCRRCPLRESCCGARTKFKKIDDSIHKEHYDRMHEKLTKQAEKARRMSRIRSKTVEPVLGTLLNFLGMKRVNTRGIHNANKHVMMAALSYNLKKLLKFERKRSQGQVIAQKVPRIDQKLLRNRLYWTSDGLKVNILVN